MKILHLTSEFPPVIWGGLGTAVGGLVTALSRTHDEVGVLLIGGVLQLGETPYAGIHPVSAEQVTKGLQSTGEKEGIKFFHIIPSESVEAGLSIARYWKPDVLHLHSAWLWPVARAIRDTYGTPIVFTVHSIDRMETTYERNMVDSRGQDEVIESADRLIVISDSERDLIAKWFPSLVSRVRTIGNGIDDNDFAASHRKHIKKSGEDTLTILYSGRFVDRKGIHELMDAMPRVLSQSAKARFVLVGGYGNAPTVRQLWLNESLRPFGDRIEFTGWLTPDEVANHYAASDIQVIPSWYEPFGMVALEGMLYGLAIASSDVGGLGEILSHRKTALLFPAKNSVALADAILEFIHSPGLRDRLSNKAAEEVRSKWLWKSVVKKIQKVYWEFKSELTINATMN